MDDPADIFWRSPLDTLPRESRPVRAGEGLDKPSPRYGSNLPQAGGCILSVELRIELGQRGNSLSLGNDNSARTLDGNRKLDGFIDRNPGIDRNH